MSRQIQIRRGTAMQHNDFTGAIGEITMDTTNNTLRVHDGVTAGGHIIAKLQDTTNTDLSNISSVAKEYISHQSMPNDSYINLTLGASGAKYTAPADGYITLSKQAGASGQELELKNETTTLSIKMASYGTSSPSLIMPVSKNDEFSVKYNTSGTTWYFRFVYANGAV